MRRRIWWYIVRLNVRATELEGLSESPIPAHSDALLPLNLDDEVSILLSSYSSALLTPRV